MNEAPAVTEATAGAVQRPVVRVRDGRAERGEDAVAAEEPLEIRLAQGERVRRLAVTMRTPGHDAELAVGFLVGEGVVRTPGDVVSAEHAPLQGGQADPNIVVVRLAAGVAFDASRLERHVYTTSSCGVCGKASLEAVGVLRGPALPAGPVLAPEAILALPRALRAGQAVFAQTGGLHAAALVSSRGETLCLREDVGRHNAVDAVVGSFFLDRAAVPTESVLVVSGRASFELVQKAVVAGVPVLAAVGAPSSLAVDLADEAGLTLVGFVREGRFTVYTNAERVALPA